MTIRQRRKTSVDHRRRAAWPCGQQDNEHVFDFQPRESPGQRSESGSSSKVQHARQIVFGDSPCSRASRTVRESSSGMAWEPAQLRTYPSPSTSVKRRHSSDSRTRPEYGTWGARRMDTRGGSLTAARTVEHRIGNPPHRRARVAPRSTMVDARHRSTARRHHGQDERTRHVQQTQ